MKATSNGTSGQLLRLSQASELLGMDPQALRRMASLPSSPLRVITLPSGHRRFVRSSLTSLMSPDGGASDDPVDDTIPICVCVRVSTEKQAQTRGNSTQSDLDRQVDRMDKFVAEKFQGQKIRITKYIRQASSVNFGHPVLLNMLNDLLDGRFRGGFCCIATPDRLGRVGLKLLEWLIEERGSCKILYCEENEAPGSDAEMVAEILNCIQFWCAKKIGARTRARYKVFLTHEQLKEAWELYNSGYGIRYIVKLFNSKNYKDDKGRSFSFNIIRSNINENKEKLLKLYGNKGVKSSLDEYIERHVLVTENKADVVWATELCTSYRRWAKSQGLDSFGIAKVKAQAIKRGWSARKSRDATSRFRTQYVGVKLMK